MKPALPVRLAFLPFILLTGSALAAETVLYDNDFPDGKVAVASGGAFFENETADDFVLAKTSQITSGSFTGLIPKGVSIDRVGIEIYGRVTSEPLLKAVPTRVNSPTDEGLPGTIRETGAGLTYSSSLLNNGVGVANSVVADIFPGNTSADTITGGEGGASGQEVRFNFSVNPNNPLTLGPGHYFFVPTVDLSDGDFLWLSAGRPIGDFGSTPISPDLQAWTRDGFLAPDWLRVGTDIIGPEQDPATYNAAFRLVGQVVPEPSAIAMLVAGLIAVGAWSRGKLN